MAQQKNLYHRARVAIGQVIASRAEDAIVNMAKRTMSQAPRRGARANASSELSFLEGLGVRLLTLRDDAPKSRSIAKGLDRVAGAMSDDQKPTGQTSSRGLRHTDRRLGSSASGWLKSQLATDAARFSSYYDYDNMDVHDGILGTAMDVYANNVCASDEGDEVIYRIVTKDATIARLAEGLEERTQLKQKTWGFVRDGLKYGDLFAEKCFDAQSIMWNVKFLSPYSMYREEDERGNLEHYEQKTPSGTMLEQWFPWEILHFRNMPDPGAKYGRSKLNRARKDFRRLGLMEDATSIMVLQRAAFRLIHQVPVRDMGDMGQEDLDRYIEDNERTDIYDSSRGTYSSQYTPMDYDDIYVPVPMDADLKVIPKVEGLDGQKNYDKVIKVLEYFENKLFVVVGVPKSYLGIERDVNARATLIQQEIEFGRALRRLQSAWAQAYRREIYDLQFRMVIGAGFDPKSYTLEFPNPSKVDDKMKAEIRKYDAETAKIYGEGFGLPLDAILVNFFNWNEDDAAKVATDAGVNTQESLDLTNVKARRLLGDIEQKVVQSMRLASAFETTNNIAEYLLEAREPVRAAA